MLDIEGEDPVDAAARELKEEADAEAENWTELGSFALSPGGSNEVIRIYLATGVRMRESEYHRVEEEAD
ncbi:MAG: NUDIX domain-containing protein, partial [Leuconostoc fallax]